MGDCPKCGLADPGAVDFCPNPQCRTYLGWASAAATPQAAAPPQVAGRLAAPEAQPTAALPLHAGGAPTMQQPQRPVAASPAEEPAAGPTQKRGVRVTMEPAELMVDPGGEVTTTVTVRNLGTRVEEFGLAPQGTAAAFASVTPVTVSVYPDLEQHAVLRFAPLRGPQSPAGVTTFEIVARSVVHTDVCDVARGRLTITPFDDLKAVLTPDLSRGRKPVCHQVSVTNGGNTPVTTQLALHDQDGALTFAPQEGTATLQPGTTEDLPVLVNGPRRWFGRTERYPFSAVLTPASPQPPITLNGTRQQTAVFPWWVPLAAVAVVALVIALAALLKPGMPAVPVIGSVDETTAVKQLKDADYIPDVVRRGDDNVAPGLAIKTDPAGGTPLKRGEHVILFISTGKCSAGPCPVEVPNVEGLPLTEAQAKLENQKFTVRIIKEPNDDRPVDRVIASDPEATTLRPLGSEVVLTVSSGPKEQNNPSPPVPPVLPAPGAGGSGSSASSSAPPPLPVAIPDLTARSADDATKALTDLGLKAKTVMVHSNAVPAGQVLSTRPAAASKAEPGSEVTLTVAQNTARADLIATADQAAWKSEAGKLAFPGKVGDSAPFALVRAATLADGTTVQVLETHPSGNGFITGVYTLAQPVVPGDRVRARVGLLPGAGGAGGQVTFQVKANGQVIQKVTISAGQFTELDADLSPAKGATAIEITVLAGASTTQDSPVWQDLRLEPKIG